MNSASGRTSTEHRGLVHDGPEAAPRDGLRHARPCGRRSSMTTVRGSAEAGVDGSTAAISKYLRPCILRIQAPEEGRPEWRS